MLRGKRKNNKLLNKKNELNFYCICYLQSQTLVFSCEIVEFIS